MKVTRSLLLTGLLTVGAVLGSQQALAVLIPPCPGEVADAAVLAQLKQAPRNNNTEVFVTGVVTRVLPEDTQGKPHEKFIINVGNIAVEVVHNLDFSPLIPVSNGSQVTVCGVFLPVGPTGAMIHWTHYDPANRHPGGFVWFNGNAYGTRP